MSGEVLDGLLGEGERARRGLSSPTSRRGGDLQSLLLPLRRLAAGCGDNCGGGCIRDGAGSTRTPAVDARLAACRGCGRVGDGSARTPAVEARSAGGRRDAGGGGHVGGDGSAKMLPAGS
uniref:DUF834 domain-containing protein n=1 Tax=Oryza glumipatula TaxID=40148 RepID=A0A0D9Z6L1_9ORYZ